MCGNEYKFFVFNFYFNFWFYSHKTYKSTHIIQPFDCGRFELSVDFYSAILNFARATCTECFAERQQSLQFSSYISQYFVYLRTKSDDENDNDDDDGCGGGGSGSRTYKKLPIENFNVWTEESACWAQSKHETEIERVVVFASHTHSHAPHTRYQLRSVRSSLYEHAELINIRFDDKLNLTCDSDVYENELNQIRKAYTKWNKQSQLK